MLRYLIGFNGAFGTVIVYSCADKYSLPVKVV